MIKYMSFSAKSFKKIAENSNLIRLNSIVSETNSYVKEDIKVSEEYSMAVSEVLEIIKLTNKPTVKKISKKILDFFQEKQYGEYVEKFNSKMKIEEVILLPKTMNLITMLYRNYLCTLKERDMLDELLRKNCELERKMQILDDDTEGFHKVDTLSDSQELDEEFECDKKFNFYINMKDFNLEKQLIKLKRLKKKIGR